MAVVHQQGTPRVSHGPGTPMLALIALITTLVVIGGFALWQSRQDDSVVSAPTAVVTAEPASIFTAEEEIMMKLARQAIEKNIVKNNHLHGSATIFFKCR